MIGGVTFLFEIGNIDRFLQKEKRLQLPYIYLLRGLFVRGQCFRSGCDQNNTRATRYG